MKIIATTKKTTAAVKNEWTGIGMDNCGGTTAVYTVSFNGVAAMTISGGDYGYMESPMWNVVCVLTGKVLFSKRSFKQAKAWATSDLGMIAWTDLNWKSN